MRSRLDQLANEIETSRLEMVQLAANCSLTDETVIEASARLDNLLNTYHFLLLGKTP